MGVLSFLRTDKTATDDAKKAMKEARTGKDAGALESLVNTFRDIGIDGKATFASAKTVAKRAKRRRSTERAVKKIIASHRRRATVGGFVTGLGGAITLPVMLPANVLEFYVIATRMTAAIASVRGYDINDQEIRTRILAALVGEESGDLLGSVGLGPVGGAASRQVAKRLPQSDVSRITKAIGARAVRRFSLRSARLFGKAIPGAGGVLGAWADRRALKKIAQTAKATFPPLSRKELKAAAKAQKKR
ncbi:EcsC family protein [Helcobacillus sp. ACRRO]|uniref:EcsC family protein n=1 Tax=Helcobacillus sp. ACRRO TaxID=2918202 RepID=UPI001EF56198|nr:EcsC family protein [Helcobacillus sp. ACRRO]